MVGQARLGSTESRDETRKGSCFTQKRHCEAISEKWKKYKLKIYWAAEDGALEQSDVAASAVGQLNPSSYHPEAAKLVFGADPPSPLVAAAIPLLYSPHC